jgi:hypothetical protein
MATLFTFSPYSIIILVQLIEFIVKKNNHKRNTLAHLDSDNHTKAIDNGSKGHI